MSKEQIDYRNLKYKTISLEEPAPVEGEVVTDVDTIFVKQVSATEFELYVSDSTGYVVKLERKLDKLTFNDFVREYIENNAPEIRTVLEKNAIKLLIYNSNVEGLVLDVGGRKLRIPLTPETHYSIYVDPQKPLKFIKSDNPDVTWTNHLYISNRAVKEYEYIVTDQEEVEIGFSDSVFYSQQEITFEKA